MQDATADQISSTHTHHPGCVSIPFNTSMEGLDVVINHISIPRETIRQSNNTNQPFLHGGRGLSVKQCFLIGCRRERGSLTTWASAGRKWRMQDVWSQCLSLFPFTILETWHKADSPHWADRWSKRYTLAKCSQRLRPCYIAAIPITAILVMTRIVLVIYSLTRRANDNASGDNTWWLCLALCTSVMIIFHKQRSRLCLKCNTKITQPCFFTKHLLSKECRS